MPTRYATLCVSYALETLGDESAILVIDDRLLETGQGLVRGRTPLHWLGGQDHQLPNRSIRRDVRGMAMPSRAVWMEEPARLKSRGCTKRCGLCDEAQDQASHDCSRDCRPLPASAAGFQSRPPIQAVRRDEGERHLAEGQAARQAFLGRLCAIAEALPATGCCSSKERNMCVIGSNAQNIAIEIGQVKIASVVSAWAHC